MDTDISQVFGNALNSTVKAVKGVRKVVPVNIRQFAGAAFGNNSPLTEDDFWQSDLDAMKGAVSKNMAGKGTGFVKPGDIGYGDYGTGEGGEFSKWDGGYRGQEGIGLFASLLQSYIDPKFRLETTLGMAKYKPDADGNIIVEDNYNFNATPNEIEGAVNKAGGKFNAMKNSYRDAGFEGLMNAIGNLYIAPEGNGGTPVRINLGKVNKKP